VFLLVGPGVTLDAGVSLETSTFVASLLYDVESRDRVTRVDCELPRTLE